MKNIKIFILLLLVMAATTNIFAQSSAVKKAVEAGFTLTTFKADGSINATSNGVFISSNGIAVSPWTPFIGASKAVAIDAKGQRHEIDCLLGADVIYNLAKFQVKGSTPTATLAAANANQTVWITPTATVSAPVKATATATEQFMSKYNYYTLTSNATDKLNGAAVVNDKGQVVGLFNISSTLQSATDVALAKDFQLKGLSQNDANLRQSSIRIGLPGDQQEAIIALMLSSDKPKEIYNATVQDFINKFPKATEGYNTYANTLIGEGNLSQADKVMQNAISNAAAKDEAHYNYARNIYLSAATPSLEEKTKQLGWSFDKAMREVQTANKIKPSNLYKHLESQIIFAKGDYQTAYNGFEALTKTDFNNPELYLEMAQSKQHLGAKDDEILALLNQCIEKCDTPYVSTSAPYFLARARQFEKMQQYRNAIKDYYTYEYFMVGRLAAEFYYNREQLELKAKMWQQALQDIAIAARLDPKEALYPTEAANIFLRINKPETAIDAAKQAIQLDPQFADAYLLLGIAQCESKNKTEGLKNIAKAKELGNTQADSFLKKYK